QNTQVLGDQGLRSADGVDDLVYAPRSLHELGDNRDADGRGQCAQQFTGCLIRRRPCDVDGVRHSRHSSSTTSGCSLPSSRPPPSGWSPDRRRVALITDPPSASAAKPTIETSTIVAPGAVSYCAVIAMPAAAASRPTSMATCIVDRNPRVTSCAAATG